MLELDVMLKFWELLFALVAAGIIVIGSVILFLNMQRRRIRHPFYVEAGGVTLSIGEERLLEAIARAPAEPDRSLSALSKALGVEERALHDVARMLQDKNLVDEQADAGGGAPRFELSAAGNEAALARGYLKLL